MFAFIPRSLKTISTFPMLRADRRREGLSGKHSAAKYV